MIIRTDFLHSSFPRFLPSLLPSLLTTLLPSFLHSWFHPLILLSFIRFLYFFLPQRISFARVFLGTDKKKIIERLRYEVRTAFPSRVRESERALQKSLNTVRSGTTVLYELQELKIALSRSSE
jgi:hypothetical protein